MEIDKLQNELKKLPFKQDLSLCNTVVRNLASSRCAFCYCQCRLERRERYVAIEASTSESYSFGGTTWKLLIDKSFAIGVYADASAPSCRCRINIRNLATVLCTVSRCSTVLVHTLCLHAVY
eukprot:COSAG06_NODE_15518_length_1065_cov_1.106625_1_plen_121_part_10